MKLASGGTKKTAALFMTMDTSPPLVISFIMPERVLGMYSSPGRNVSMVLRMKLNVLTVNQMIKLKM